MNSYRAKALKWHPAKHSGKQRATGGDAGGDDEKTDDTGGNGGGINVVDPGIAARNFALVAEAYAVLIDGQRRAVFDQYGYVV